MKTEKIIVAASEPQRKGRIVVVSSIINLNFRKTKCDAAKKAEQRHVIIVNKIRRFCVIHEFKLAANAASKS